MPALEDCLGYTLGATTALTITYFTLGAVLEQLNQRGHNSMVSGSDAASIAAPDSNDQASSGDDYSPSSNLVSALTWYERSQREATSSVLRDTLLPLIYNKIVETSAQISAVDNGGTALGSANPTPSRDVESTSLLDDKGPHQCPPPTNASASSAVISVKSVDPIYLNSLTSYRQNPGPAVPQPSDNSPRLVTSRLERSPRHRPEVRSDARASQQMSTLSTSSSAPALALAPSAETARARFGTKSVSEPLSWSQLIGHVKPDLSVHDSRVRQAMRVRDGVRRIQALIRGHRARRSLRAQRNHARFQRTELKRRQAAIVIQRNVRGRLSRSRVKGLRGSVTSGGAAPGDLRREVESGPTARALRPHDRDREEEYERTIAELHRAIEALKSEHMAVLESERKSRKLEMEFREQEFKLKLEERDAVRMREVAKNIELEKKVIDTSKKITELEKLRVEERKRAAASKQDMEEGHKSHMKVALESLKSKLDSECESELKRQAAVFHKKIDDLELLNKQTTERLDALKAKYDHLRNKVESVPFSEGHYVEARHNHGSNWYKGTIIKCHIVNNRYDIEYFDGDFEKNVSFSDIRYITANLLNHTKEFEVDTRVEFRAAGGFLWFTGYISRLRSNGSYDVRHTDGCTEYKVPPECVRLQLYSTQYSGNNAANEESNDANLIYNNVSTSSKGVVSSKYSRNRRISRKSSVKYEVSQEVLFKYPSGNVWYPATVTKVRNHGRYYDLILGTTENREKRISGRSISYVEEDSYNIYVERNRSDSDDEVGENGSGRGIDGGESKDRIPYKRGSVGGVERRGSMSSERRGSFGGMEKRGSFGGIERRGSVGPAERRGSYRSDAGDVSGSGDCVELGVPEYLIKPCNNNGSSTRTSVSSPTPLVPVGAGDKPPVDSLGNENNDRISTVDSRENGEKVDFFKELVYPEERPDDIASNNDDAYGYHRSSSISSTPSHPPLMRSYSAPRRSLPDSAAKSLQEILGQATSESRAPESGKRQSIVSGSDPTCGWRQESNLLRAALIVSAQRRNSAFQQLDDKQEIYLGRKAEIWEISERNIGAALKIQRIVRGVIARRKYLVLQQFLLSRKSASTASLANRSPQLSAVQLRHLYLHAQRTIRMVDSFTQVEDIAADKDRRRDRSTLHAVRVEANAQTEDTLYLEWQSKRRLVVEALDRDVQNQYHARESLHLQEYSAQMDAMYASKVDSLNQREGMIQKSLDQIKRRESIIMKMHSELMAEIDAEAKRRRREEDGAKETLLPPPSKKMTVHQAVQVSGLPGLLWEISTQTDLTSSPSTTKTPVSSSTQTDPVTDSVTDGEDEETQNDDSVRTDQRSIVEAVTEHDLEIEKLLKELEVEVVNETLRLQSSYEELKAEKNDLQVEVQSLRDMNLLCEREVVECVMEGMVAIVGSSSSMEADKSATVTADACVSADRCIGIEVETQTSAPEIDSHIHGDLKVHVLKELTNLQSSYGDLVVEKNDLRDEVHYLRGVNLIRERELVECVVEGLVRLVESPELSSEELGEEEEIEPDTMITFSDVGVSAGCSIGVGVETQTERSEPVSVTESHCQVDEFVYLRTYISEGDAAVRIQRRVRGMLCRTYISRVRAVQRPVQNNQSLFVQETKGNVVPTSASVEDDHRSACDRDPEVDLDVSSVGEGEDESSGLATGIKPGSEPTRRRSTLQLEISMQSQVQSIPNISIIALIFRGHQVVFKAAGILNNKPLFHKREIDKEAVTIPAAGFPLEDIHPKDDFYIESNMDSEFYDSFSRLKPSVSETREIFLFPLYELEDESNDGVSVQLKFKRTNDTLDVLIPRSELISSVSVALSNRPQVGNSLLCHENCGGWVEVGMLVQQQASANSHVQSWYLENQAVFEGFETVLANARNSASVYNRTVDKLRSRLRAHIEHWPFTSVEESDADDGCARDGDAGDNNSDIVATLSDGLEKYADGLREYFSSACLSSLPVASAQQQKRTSIVAGKDFDQSSATAKERGLGSILSQAPQSPTSLYSIKSMLSVLSKDSDGRQPAPVRDVQYLQNQFTQQMQQCPPVLNSMYVWSRSHSEIMSFFSAFLDSSRIAQFTTREYLDSTSSVCHSITDMSITKLDKYLWRDWVGELSRWLIQITRLSTDDLNEDGPHAEPQMLQCFVSPEEDRL
eukprot:gene400-421_t